MITALFSEHFVKTRTTDPRSTRSNEANTLENHEVAYRRSIPMTDLAKMHEP
jgi:hypothetical protein